MTRILIALLAVAGIAGAAAKSLQLKDLPPAVQKTINENLKGATIKNIAKETEDGKVQYEVESVLNGKTRDFNVDTAGKLLVMEDEVSIDSIPAPAKAAIQKTVGTGKLTRVESVTEGVVTTYEAAYTTKAGKKMTTDVRADGSPVKPAAK